MAAAIDAPLPYDAVHMERVIERAKPHRMRHRYHVLGVMLRFDGRYRLGTTVLPSHRPILSFLPAGHEEEGEISGRVDNWFTRFTWRALRIERRDQASVALTMDGRRILLPYCKAVDAVTATAMIDLIARVGRALARGDVASSLLARALVLEQFALYVDAPTVDADATGTHRALARFREALEQRACDPITIERLAAGSGLTHDYLSDLFHQRFGVRPVEYRTNVRLAKARELLTTTTMNVKQVAHQVGYPDALYFSRVFRQHLGLSPRELIRRYPLMR